jgi:hypothetical protein
MSRYVSCLIIHAPFVTSILHTPSKLHNGIVCSMSGQQRHFTLPCYASTRVICTPQHLHRLCIFISNILCFCGIYCLKTDIPRTGRALYRQTDRQTGALWDGSAHRNIANSGTEHSQLLQTVIHLLFSVGGGGRRLYYQHNVKIWTNTRWTIPSDNKSVQYYSSCIISSSCAPYREQVIWKLSSLHLWYRAVSRC